MSVGPGPVCFLTKQYRVISEIERALKRGASMPHVKYNKGKVEEHKLEIQRILANLNAPSSNVDEYVPHPATVYPHTATASISESGMSLVSLSPISYGRLITPRFFPP